MTGALADARVILGVAGGLLEAKGVARIVVAVFDAALGLFPAEPGGVAAAGAARCCDARGVSAQLLCAGLGGGVLGRDGGAQGHEADEYRKLHLDLVGLWRRRWIVWEFLAVELYGWD